jgi:FkbM family methyltransferase
MKRIIRQVIKKIAKKIGIEIIPYSPSTSSKARMHRLLTHNNIDLVLDVGANDGRYGTILRNLGYSGRIVSFEPTSNAYSKLKTMSNKDILWEIAPRIAIGNENSEIQINIAGNSLSSSVLTMLDTHLKAAPESAYVSSEIVKMSRLDTIAKTYIKSDTKSIFLKIDVQGFEKQVLEGAVEILPLIKGIQLELSLIPLYEDETLFKEMINLLENLGYYFYAVIPGLTDMQTGRLLQMDGIFFKS